VQASYAIGVSEPISIYINTFESEKISLSEIQGIVQDNFDLSPSGLINSLNLMAPVYLKTASYGHFGREDHNFEWEKPVKF
jgi:S-adenosylmethionine synthetase